MEELASRGYWVASIAHTYESPAVVFEDGRVVGWNAEAVGGLLGDEDESFFESFVTTEDPAQRDDLVRSFLAEQTDTSRSMKVWNADTHTVVDEIERIGSGERATPFAGRLDLDRLAVLGMSFGGAAAGVFCVEDPRCKAGLNLDGFHYGDGMADAVVRVPFMILSGRYGKIPINEFFFRHAAGPAYIARIDGSTHMNFTDTSITSPSLRWLGALGEIDGDRMLHIINVYVGAFFDVYLRGESSSLLEGDSVDYPEVELLSRNTGS
jgi:predicted dienelactone hydrolase